LREVARTAGVMVVIGRTSVHLAGTMLQ